MDDNTYTRPIGAVDWAGASWLREYGEYPSFENGGRITFNYENNSESTITLRFDLGTFPGRYAFECLPGSAFAEIIVLSGVEEVSNFILHIETPDSSIILTDFKIYKL